MSRRAIGTVLVLAALTTPPASHAASVNHTARPGEDLEYTAGDNEQNNLRISVNDGKIVFDDSVRVHAQGRCENTGPQQARCPLPGEAGFVVTLEDRADRVEVDVDIANRTFGGSGDDVLLGGGVNRPDEYLIGDEGDDEIRGRGGPDSLIGGPDDDVLDAGGGAGFVSFLKGNGGNDELIGGPGRDQLLGGPDDDEISGGDGDDAIEGNGDVDEIAGGPGDDRLEGKRGNDSLAGGDGSDKLSGGPDEDRLLGDDGNDRLSGVGGDDAIEGGVGDDRVFGGGGSDELQGGDGDDHFGTIERHYLGGRTASEVDTAACGPGVDAVRSALPDTVVECEQVLVWSTLAVTPVPVVADDAAVLSVSCTADTGCSGSVTLSLPDPGRDIGEARVDVAANQSGEVRVPLSSEDAELLRQGAVIAAAFERDEDPPDTRDEGYRVRLPET